MCSLWPGYLLLLYSHHWVKRVISVCRWEGLKEKDFPGWTEGRARHLSRLHKCSSFVAATFCLMVEELLCSGALSSLKQFLPGVGVGGDTQTCRVPVWIYLWQATFSFLTTLMSEGSEHNFGDQTRVTSCVSFFGYLWFHGYSKENYELWKRTITMNKGVHLSLLLSLWHIAFLDTIPRHCVEKSELLNKVVRLFQWNSRSLENLSIVLSKTKHFLSLPSFSLYPLPPSLVCVGGGLVHARQAPYHWTVSTIILKETVSLCGPGYPETLYVAKAGFGLICLPQVFQMLQLQVCTTMPGLWLLFNRYIMVCINCIYWVPCDDLL